MAKDAEDKEKPKRDPNKPFPKPKARKTVVLKFAVAATTVVLITWMGLYSAKVGKPPWAWDEQERTGFVDYSKDQIEEARANVRDQLKNVDWDKLVQIEDKLQKKLAELRAKRGAKAGAGDPGATTTPETAGAEGQPAAVVEPTELELGCDALQMGIRHYKKSGKSQSELRKAKGLFHEAREHLEKAYNKADADGDAAAASEIEGYMMQCNVYLEDCSKREILK